MIPQNGDKQKKKGFLKTLVTEGGKVAGGVVVGGAAIAGGKAIVTKGLPAAGRGALALGKAGYSAVSTGFGVTKIPDVVKGIPTAVKKAKAAPGKIKAGLKTKAKNLTKGMGKDIAKATQQGLSEAMKPVSKTRAFAGEAGKRGIPSQVKIPKGTNTLAMYGQPEFKNPVNKKVTTTRSVKVGPSQKVTTRVSGKIGTSLPQVKGQTGFAQALKKQMGDNIATVTTKTKVGESTYKVKAGTLTKKSAESGLANLRAAEIKKAEKAGQVIKGDTIYDVKKFKTKTSAVDKVGGGVKTTFDSKGRPKNVKLTNQTLDFHDTRSPKVRRQINKITDRAERDIAKIQASGQPTKIKDARTANVVKRAGQAISPIGRKAAIKQGLRAAARVGSTAVMALGPVGVGVGLAAKAAINLSTANDIYKISKEVLPKRKR